MKDKDSKDDKLLELVHGLTVSENTPLCEHCKGANSTIKENHVLFQNCLRIGEEDENGYCLDPFLGKDACEKKVCGDILKCHEDFKLIKAKDDVLQGMVKLSFSY